MTEPREKPHPLLLERYLAGVATDAERAQLSARYSADELRALEAEHEALHAELMVRRPPAEVARVVALRAARERDSARRVVVRPAWAVALSALVVLLWVARRDLDGGEAAPRLAPGGASEPVERAKGLRPSLRVYRKRGALPELLADGQPVRQGDVLQLGYLAPGMTHGVLLSIDGRGEVTLHFPEEGAASTRLRARGGEQLLPSAYELDDAPGFERFIFISAARALNAADVVRAAERVARGEGARRGPLALANYADQVSVLLTKDER